MSDFRSWAKAMGFHGKQVSKAGDAIGLGQSIRPGALSRRETARPHRAPCDGGGNGRFAGLVAGKSQ